jgi:hypothetical protein
METSRTFMGRLAKEFLIAGDKIACSAVRYFWVFEAVR